MSEELLTGYDIFNPDELRTASEGLGMYAGGLSLALLGVGPETLDRQQPVFTVPATSELREFTPNVDASYLHELSQTEALRRLSRLSLNGSVEPFTRADLS
jgi:hypothetical protein